MSQIPKQFKQEGRDVPSAVEQNKTVIKIEEEKVEDKIDVPKVVPVTNDVKSQRMKEMLKKRKEKHELRKQGKLPPLASSKIDPNQIVIISLEYPQHLPVKSPHKYFTKITFSVNGVSQKKKISFGRKGALDYIDGGEQAEVIKNLNSTALQSFIGEPLKPNFYRYWLLNTKPTLVEAFTDLMKNLKLA
jgi:hypothetical protein